MTAKAPPPGNCARATILDWPPVSSTPPAMRYFWPATRFTDPVGPSPQHRGGASRSDDTDAAQIGRATGRFEDAAVQSHRSSGETATRRLQHAALVHGRTSRDRHRPAGDERAAGGDA